MPIKQANQKPTLTSRTAAARSNRASSIVELPVALSVLFLALLFPLADLGTIALRSATVFAAARNAAHHAGRAKSFVTNGENGQLSAKSTAVARALQTCNFGICGTQIKAEDVRTKIIGTPFAANISAINSASPLPDAEPEKYLYQIEVEVTGTVEPLVLLNNELLGDIPGITKPLMISAAFREFCEHPEGMTM